MDIYIIAGTSVFVVVLIIWLTTQRRVVKPNEVHTVKRCKGTDVYEESRDNSYKKQKLWNYIRKETPFLPDNDKELPECLEKISRDSLLKFGWHLAKVIEKEGIAKQWYDQYIISIAQRQFPSLGEDDRSFMDLSHIRIDKSCRLLTEFEEAWLADRVNNKMIDSLVLICYLKSIIKYFYEYKKKVDPTGWDLYDKTEVKNSYFRRKSFQKLVAAGAPYVKASETLDIKQDKVLEVPILPLLVGEAIGVSTSFINGFDETMELMIIGADEIEAINPPFVALFKEYLEFAQNPHKTLAALKRSKHKQLQVLSA